MRPARLPARLLFLPIMLLLSLVLCACGGRNGATTNANQSAIAASPSGNSSNASADANDISKLDAEITELEKQAEMSPGDESLRTALSQAYLKRANARRDARQLREALSDYQEALRFNPDNEEASSRAAEISPQIEEGRTGENGEPAPLPITPNVTTADDSNGNTAAPATPSPTAQPKKKP
jgi:tetratricopeptide (TPR) repeat protein